jgi:1-acyl-sn-glycerol-3-phosphate acyltransferase
MSTNAETADGLGIASILLSLTRVLVFYVFSALYIPVVILVALLKPGSTYYPLARLWAALSLKIFGVTVDATGTERLEPGRDYVILANHRSHFDVLAIVNALHDRETRWVAKRELTKVPIFGTALRVTGQIIVDRSDHEQAVRTLRENLSGRGVSVVFFPEGHRVADRQLLPFKKGGAAFAIDAGLPIVPLAVSGSERTLPTGSILPRPGAIRVLVGDPIDVSSMTTNDREALTERARRAILSLLSPLESGAVMHSREVAGHA